MTDRTEMADEFLRAAGWADARRQAIPGDASDRSYLRLTGKDRGAILMDAPPGQGDDPADFVRIAQYLTQIGLSAPQIMAQDLDRDSCYWKTLATQFLPGSCRMIRRRNPIFTRWPPMC